MQESNDVFGAIRASTSRPWLIAIATLLALGGMSAANAQTGSAVPVVGELKRWHKITLDFPGPDTSETATPNPFTDYRLNVTFSHVASGKTYLVPGFYAADGNAANTSASGGNLWRVHFAPDQTGEWRYAASFRSGANVAMDAAADAGLSGGFFDGMAGNFIVQTSDKTGRDMRAKGRLEYTGKHHLRYAGTGNYFMKAGTDSPENLLSYVDFDGDFKTDGKDDERVKTWTPHVADWQEGDPSWAGGKGKGLIGAINYLASEGLNSFSFLTMNINGDDKNVFPYLSYTERLRLDVSRMEQWEMVFDHGTRMGMHLHFKTQETENETLLDSGNMGNQRKLYYRELIARFGHNLALNWNLGEEINNASLAQKQAWAQYFHDNDPYHHPIVIHNGASHFDMMGDASKLTGFSLQMNESNFSDTFYQTKRYVKRSEDFNRPWVVACDEPGDSRLSVRPDNDAANSHRDARRDALWGNIMAGGAGCEFYFGYDKPNGDLTLEDFRSRDAFWDYCRYTLQFFEENEFPFEQMQNHNELVSGSGDNANRCLAKIGSCYLVQLRDGGTATLNLTGVTGTFTAKWLNPRAGGPLTEGITLEGGGIVSLGTPPDSPGEDWVVLLQSASGGSGTNAPPSVSAGADKSAFLIGGSVDVTLTGETTDDGLPDESALIRKWSAVSGPAPVSFYNTATVTTVASFTAAGTYVLELAATDGDLSAGDAVTVTISLPEVGGERTFSPVEDAYVEAGENRNDTTLRAGSASPVQISYLKFDLASLDDAPESSVLRLTVAEASGGDVTLRLFAGTGNDWNEGGIDGDNAPATGVEIAGISRTLETGELVEFDLGSHVGAAGIYTFILIGEPSAGTGIFASSEHGTVAARPSLQVTLPENGSPLLPPFVASTVVNKPLLLSHAELLQGASDPDGDPVTLVITEGATTNGGEVTMDESGLIYTPAIDYIGPDSFQLTAQDGRGAFAVAELTLQVVSSDGTEGKVVVMETLPEGGTKLTFAGVPNLAYGIQRSEDLVEWETILSIRAAVDGSVEWIDAEPPAGRQFYRVSGP